MSVSVKSRSTKFPLQLNESLRWRNFGLAAAIGLFIIVFILGPTFLLPTQEDDAKTVLQLAREALYIGGSGGYYYTALLSASIPEVIQRILVFVLGVGFIYRVFRDLRHPPAVGFAVFLTIAPTFLFLTLFVKDSSIPLLTVVVLGTLQSRYRGITRIALVLFIYTVYGAAFRQYYYLIAVAFLACLVGVRLSPSARVLYFLSAIILMLLVPDDYFNSLQGARDALNQFRLGRDIAGARTAFGNLLPPSDLFNFVINYGYAIVKLNFSFLFDPGVREIFLSLNAMAFATLTWFGLRSRNEKVRTPALLFMAHFLVSMLFEPDLGAYLRHASSVILYLVPALVMLDNRSPAARIPHRMRRRRIASDRLGGHS